MALTLDYVISRSASKFIGLHPVVEQAAIELVKRCYYRGVFIQITQGLRTIAEQDELYAQGRTKPGPIVTQAPGGHSNHNFGIAIDFALLMPDGRAVSWDTKLDSDHDLIKDWNEVVEEAKKIGFTWGGDWASFKDLPHLEIQFGLTNAQYRAGKRPSQASMDVILAKINPPKVDPPKSPVTILGEDEENVAMKLEDWAWPMIQSYLADAAKKGYVDQSWLKKVDSKSLTAAELAFLNTIIAQRSGAVK